MNLISVNLFRRELLITNSPARPFQLPPLRPSSSSSAATSRRLPGLGQAATPPYHHHKSHHHQHKEIHVEQYQVDNSIPTHRAAPVDLYHEERPQPDPPHVYADGQEREEEAEAAAYSDALRASVAATQRPQGAAADTRGHDHDDDYDT